MLNIKDINVNYIRYGNEKGKTIVLLHGWGQNIEMMKPIGDAFSETNDIVIFDLPGYGKSEEPKYDWQVKDYVECINECLKKLKIKKPILIGHSFGGKISLMYSSIYEVEKLILFGSPFRKGIEKLSMKTKMLKQLKKVPGLNKFEEFAKRHIGSTDYRNASPLMRKILVNTVNLDITEDVKKIKCPTIIVWGTLDEAVPLEDAYILESLIEDAAVIEYENCTHYAYLERLGQTINIISNFIKEWKIC